MKETSKAVFSFLNFKITEFSLVEPNENVNDISVGFDPHGEFDVNSKMFNLILNYKATQDGEDFIKTKLIAVFEIPNASNLDEIPTYFYRNSIAIAYPYLRAFITNMTIQAGIKPLIMPLLNLVELEKPFRDNTTLVS